MRRVLHGMAIVPSLTLLFAGGAYVGTAVAAAPSDPATLGCGSAITGNATLNHDIGPCPGDGLVVTASNVRLDLNGHTVTGSNASEHGSEQVGIHLKGVSNVTVANGTVRNFDAGVAVEGGSGNTVTGIYAHDNVNHDVLNGDTAGCDYGDGIVVDNSPRNTIEANRAEHNGPYDGIGLVDPMADNNMVSRNQVVNNNFTNLDPAGQSTVCGTGVGPMTLGRGIQDIGIRIEGPGARNNSVEGNQVTGSGLVGISVHGYYCHPPNGGQGAPPNSGSYIAHNTISGTGLHYSGVQPQQPDPNADGIGILQQGNPSAVCVSSDTTIHANNSSGNRRNGIFVGGRGSGNNVITTNTVQGNGHDGIYLAGPSAGLPGAIDNTLTANLGNGNATYDGEDGNTGCDNNTWRANRFGTVNQACVAAH